MSEHPSKDRRVSQAESSLLPPYSLLYEDLVRMALREDLGRAGDLTTDAIVPAGETWQGRIVARREGRIAGLEVALSAFRILDGGFRSEICLPDGRDASAGESLALLEGYARPMLSAERTALNFLGRLSGIATGTRRVVRAIQGSSARVVCTRKTTPGWRALEKYAVRAGGGSNHRFGLDDGVLIKDNHVLAAGGVAEAIEKARRAVGHLVKIEVEVDTLEQLETALACRAEAVLLDNMSPEVLREAVRMAKGRAITEASGGVSPENAAEIAATGVDLISMGWITHSAPNLDVSLDLETRRNKD